jgi:hypothetical protein
MDFPRWRCRWCQGVEEGVDRCRWCPHGCRWCLWEWRGWCYVVWWQCSGHRRRYRAAKTQSAALFMVLRVNWHTPYPKSRDVEWSQTRSNIVGTCYKVAPRLLQSRICHNINVRGAILDSRPRFEGWSSIR